MKLKKTVRTGQRPRVLRARITKKVFCRYLLYLPRDYGKDKRRWPLMLFLHGAGERGDDLEKVKRHGPPKLVAAGREFPFIIVSPQCPEDEVWSNDVLIALLDYMVEDYQVDEDRVYLTGLSMGGYGSWNLACTHPERFAAVVPICGGGFSLAVHKMKRIPVWVFHGAKDDVVPVEESRRMVRALQNCGGNVKLTIYPDAKHNSWTPTYENPKLYEWLLKQRRKARA